MLWVFDDEETVTRFAVDGTEFINDNDDVGDDVDVNGDDDDDEEEEDDDDVIVVVAVVVDVQDEMDSLDGTALFASVTLADVSGELGCDACCLLTRVFRWANIASWLVYEKIERKRKKEKEGEREREREK